MYICNTRSDPVFIALAFPFFPHSAGPASLLVISFETGKLKAEERDLTCGFSRNGIAFKVDRVFLSYVAFRFAWDERGTVDKLSIVVKR